MLADVFSLQHGKFCDLRNSSIIKQQNDLSNARIRCSSSDFFPLKKPVIKDEVKLAETLAPREGTIYLSSLLGLW